MTPPKKTSLNKSNLAESLIKSQPGLFILFDKEGFIHWWNNRLEHYTAYSSKQIKHLKILDLVEEQDKIVVQTKIAEAFKSGKTDFEIRLKGKNNDTVLFLITWVAIELDGDGYIIGTGIDITKLKEEQAKKEVYYQVLENSSNEILIYDYNSFNLLYMNKNARENLGYSGDRLKSIKAYEIKPEFNEKRFRDFTQPLTAEEKGNLKYETFHQRSDRSRYDVEINLQLINSNQQKILACIALDITERLKKERLLKSSLREKELLLGEVHHRVKNNLAVVSSLLNMQAGKVREDSVKHLFRESEGRIKAMSMIHQLLYEQEDFSGIDFDLYLRKLVKYLRDNYQDNKNFETEIDATDISLDINTAVPCALIVHELITNAIKHACKNQQDNCVVKVSLTEEQNIYKLIVSDNGTGLPPSFSIEKETGLGMTLIRGLTQQLRGELDIRHNGGTSFIIKFQAEE